MEIDPADLEIIETALACRAKSRAEARAVIRKMEANRAAISNDAKAEVVLEMVDHLMLVWTHHNRGYVSDKEFLTFLRRVEKHKPLPRAQRLFDLSDLSTVAQFVRVFRRHPPGVVHAFSRDRRMRPFAEIEMGSDLPRGLTACGIRSGDHLIVHVGPEAYEGSLVIASVTAPPAIPGRSGQSILFVCRILESEGGDPRSPKFRRIRIRLRDDAREGIEIESGEFRVECVIWNRDEVLADLAIN